MYVGSWDHNVYAIDADNGRKVWSFQADDQVNTSAAFWRGRIFIASDAGTLYALSARTGKLLWSAQSQSKFGSREFWYATPTVAYGRVYIGNTDGTMYVFGAKTGNLLWARPLGTYIYGAAAVYGRRVFVGTYDGSVYALDAATGDTIWRIDAHGAVHSAPTVIDGLVYYAVCSSCGSAAARAVARGPDSTYAVRARDGKTVWRFRDGKYANPVVADEERIYITGQSHQYALAPRKAKRAALAERVEEAADGDGHPPQHVERGERVAGHLERVVEAGQLEDLARPRAVLPRSDRRCFRSPAPAQPSPPRPRGGSAMGSARPRAGRARPRAGRRRCRATCRRPPRCGLPWCVERARRAVAQPVERVDVRGRALAQLEHGASRAPAPPRARTTAAAPG